MNLVQKIAKFQDNRYTWALLIFVSVGLVVLAHSLFQNYAYMPPCEQCVYIRFAFLCMALGGVIAIIDPKNLALAAVGYIFAFWGAVQGIMYSVKLAKIHAAVHGDDPFGVQGCSTEPHYPFGIPLEKWAPDWFLPTGDCGYDSPIVPDGVTLSGAQKYLVDLYQDGWYLIPSSKFMSMADCTLIGFGVCFVILAAILVCKILTLKAQKSV
ncbi:protein-disulfide oxidoreductase DsbI [Campylobacter curvus]|uniref:protein-disulfide oxidoreductase DsbI n=1 Tax=Campylobacter curvus TaxID=200 RepID=UPI00035D5A9F|nr:protein-disulfide oxidoreductase DsbI [Campylobacter curvus]QKF61200.1 protein disulfide oxidoreductase [Campylobacter curvus]UEB49520.1 protein-disulfide oxidoreductase DsbI [Campylobacter curvus]